METFCPQPYTHIQDVDGRATIGTPPVVLRRLLPRSHSAPLLSFEINDSQAS